MAIPVGDVVLLASRAVITGTEQFAVRSRSFGNFVVAVIDKGVADFVASTRRNAVVAVGFVAHVQTDRVTFRAKVIRKGTSAVVDWQATFVGQEVEKSNQVIVSLVAVVAGRDGQDILLESANRQITGGVNADLSPRGRNTEEQESENELHVVKIKN